MPKRFVCHAPACEDEVGNQSDWIMEEDDPAFEWCRVNANRFYQPTGVLGTHSPRHAQYLEMKCFTSFFLPGQSLEKIPAPPHPNFPRPSRQEGREGQQSVTQSNSLGEYQIKREPTT